MIPTPFVLPQSLPGYPCDSSFFFGWGHKTSRAPERRGSHAATASAPLMSARHALKFTGKATTIARRRVLYASYALTLVACGREVTREPAACQAHHLIQCPRLFKQMRRVGDQSQAVLNLETRGGLLVHRDHLEILAPDDE